jgi:hypothetical protein
MLRVDYCCESRVKSGQTPTHQPGHRKHLTGLRSDCRGVKLRNGYRAGRRSPVGEPRHRRCDSPDQEPPRRRDFPAKRSGGPESGPPSGNFCVLSTKNSSHQNGCYSPSVVRASDIWREFQKIGNGRCQSDPAPTKTAAAPRSGIGAGINAEKAAFLSILIEFAGRFRFGASSAPHVLELSRGGQPFWFSLIAWRPMPINSF